MVKINYAGPSITTADADFVRDAVLNGFYENYRFHATQLERKLSQLLGAKYVIATNSCTAALHLAVVSLGIGEGDEVITTDSSCVASALPIAYARATAVFVDVEPSTWCISPSAVRSAITPRTKALLVVHWNGHPAAMDEIMEIADEYNLKVIEDSAPALGAEYKGTKVGTIGDIGCFSFQGAKVAIGGQGGAFVTNNIELYERARSLSSYGRTDSQMPYWSDYQGWNYLMPNLPAALAYSQLSRLNDLIAHKRALFQWYKKGLGSTVGVRLIEEASDTKSTYCYPALLLSDSSVISREEVLMHLHNNGIDARTAQPRISKMPMFKVRHVNKVSEQIESRGIILPSAFNLGEEEISFVCECIRTIVD